jgi:hypothetical protein
MSISIEEKNKNLELLHDIINGFSEYQTEFGAIYFKHLDILQYQENISYYIDVLNSIEKEGILSEQQQIENAYKHGLWSKQKQDQIYSITKSISRLKETRKKLIYQSDKKRIDEQILDQNKILFGLEQKKREFLVLTSENVASKKSTDFYIKNFIYKNKNFSEKLFLTEEEFEFADDYFIDSVSVYYNKFLEKTSALFIKKLALSSDFQNLLFISDSPNEFFGKPVMSLTRNQIDLLIWGKYFKNIIQNVTKEIPEGLTDDPDKFLEWIDSLKDKKEQKSKNNSKSGKNSSKFLFGSSDEIKSITGEEISGNKILKEVSQKGTLSMNELMDKQA